MNSDLFSSTVVDFAPITEDSGSDDIVADGVTGATYVRKAASWRARAVRVPRSRADALKDAASRRRLASDPRTARVAKVGRTTPGRRRASRRCRAAPRGRLEHLEVGHVVPDRRRAVAAVVLEAHGDGRLRGFQIFNPTSM